MTLSSETRADGTITFLLAAASHDLKTLLTRLRFRTALLQDHDARDSITGDLDETEAMIDTILALLRSKAETEAFQPTDVSRLCIDVCDALSMQGHDVKITASIPVVLPVRRQALKRAVGNLVENGIKYGGRVRVAVERRPGKVAIIIDDDGPGIPNERVEEAFEPFKRLVGPRQAAVGGFGLGLAIVRMTAHAHRGDILLSNRVQGGLRAELLLPNGPARTEARPAAVDPPDAVAP